MAESVITDEMRSMVGEALGEPFVAGEVYRGDIYKFAKAVGDNNPLWLDEGYARVTRWGRHSPRPPRPDLADAT
jgi:acyl dehydratase